ncbi:MAG: flagellar filament capping protein FliD [Lautropia sp.]|nr:flagellar filament capping protein FliD [Lautropia sp.]
MATITASGGSIDVNSIVTQLMAIEREPLTKIQQQQAGINTKLSSWGKVKSALSELQTAAEKLTTQTTWQNNTATTSNDSQVAVTSGNGGVKGVHSLTVHQLAQSQAVASRAFASPDAVVGGGTLRIQMGSVNADGSAFTADGERAALEITVAADAKLSDIRDAINRSTSSGISASLVNDGTGTRLMLTSRETGASNAFEITATAADGSQLDALSISATAQNGSNGSQRTQIARDAQMTINGLAASSASNKVRDLIEGVTLDLKKADANPVTIEVDTNKEALKEDVDAFIEAYNKVNSLIASETRYDAGSKTAGTLQGNSTIIRIQSQLRSLVRAQLGDDDQNLSNAGFELGRDGSLSIKSDKLDDLLNDPTRLRRMLAGELPRANDTTTTTGTATAAATGLAKQFSERLKEILDTNGSLNGVTEALNRTLKTYSDRTDQLNSKLERREEQLRQQYANLDANLTRISSSFSSIAALLNSSRS